MKPRAFSAAIVACGLLIPISLAQQQPIAPAAPEPAAPTDFLDALANGAKGALTVHALQGTKDAPGVGAADFELHLFHRNQSIHQIDAKFDERGEAVVGDLPVGIGITPVIRIKYAGVVYQEVGPAMSEASRDASMNVTVYETTDVKPDWSITMRHVMAEPMGDAVAVSENVVVTNPADRTWLGEPPSAEGRRTAVSVLLPPGARNVQLEEGFHGWCCTTFTDRTLAVQMPLMPGKASYRFSYEVPAAGGRTDLTFGAGALTHNMVLFVPDDGSQAEPAALAPTGVSKMGETPVRIFQGQEIAGGQAAGIILTGLGAPAAPPVQGSIQGSSTNIAKIVAGVGAGVALLFVAVVMFRRSPSRAPAALKAEGTAL